MWFFWDLFFHVTYFSLAALHVVTLCSKWGIHKAGVAGWLVWGWEAHRQTECDGSTRLSQVGREGRAYSTARDKVIYDETDKQHWWRLHLISLRSFLWPLTWSRFPSFPLPRLTSLITRSQCQVFTILVCSTETHLVCLRTSASLQHS